MELAIIAVSLFYVNIIFGFTYSYFLAKKNKVVFQSVLQRRAPLVFFNIFLVSFLSFASIVIGIRYFSLSLPSSLFIGIAQLILFVVIDDLWFYGFHRYVHTNKFLFKKIHRQHHYAHKPLPFEFIYANPLEWMGGSVGIFLSCLFITIFFGQINAYVFCLYTFFRGLHDIFLHSQTKSNLLKYVPIFHTNEAHAQHHARFNGNYASMLSYLDVLFKTKIK